jgi:hypothetical protein
MVQAELDAAWNPMTILLLVAANVPKQSPRLQAQIRQKTADQMNSMGAFPGKLL